MNYISASRARVLDLSSIPNLEIAYDVPMRDLGRWKIGGPADVVITPHDEAALAQALRIVSASGVPQLVLGDGSNLLFDDAGFRGVVLRMSRPLSAMRIEGTRVTAQGGIWVPGFAHRVGSAGLTGAEHVIGIPGTLGGLIVMNGGSQRRGIGENLTRAVCFDANGERIVYTHAQCAFSYRRSALQTSSAVVFEAEFEFTQGNASEIRRNMIAIMADRRRKFPLKVPNCGSVFLSDPAMYDKIGPPGKAIEAAGLRGLRSGDAQIAENHGNFILNWGSASSNDVLTLIALIRKTVYERTGYRMDCEVRHVTPGGEIRPAHLSTPL